MPRRIGPLAVGELAFYRAREQSLGKRAPNSLGSEGQVKEASSQQFLFHVVCPGGEYLYGHIPSRVN